MSESRVAEADAAARLSGVADDRAEAASTANQHSDKYMLAVILFATSLFFAGMSTKVWSVRQQEVLVMLGAVILVVSAVLLAAFPAMFVT
jgi:hypothetical protein